MKTLELSGIIKIDWNDWYKIKLVQEDGYKIDLVSRFNEYKETYPNVDIQLNYWLSDKPCSKEEMLEGFLKKIFGSIEAEYEKNDYRYSSWTSGTDYDTNLKIGGHDLFKELQNEENRFIILEINFRYPNE